MSVASEEISQLKVLQTISSVYGQVASLWMSKTRDTVVTSRDYLAEMQQVFLTVFSSYIKKIRQLSNSKKKLGSEKITFLAHNGKKVTVLLSANGGFYGEIIKRTYDKFLEEVRQSDYEVVIVGKQGLASFLIDEPHRPYTYINFPDERTDQDKLLELIQHLVQYDQIRIHYPRYENLVTQEPYVFALSANPYDNLTEQEKARYYLFEPDMETILGFFEQQIFSSLFEQTMNESHLAKSAARIIVMDKAADTIKKRISVIERQEQKLKHQKSNRKQLNRFASMKLWS